MKIHKVTLASIEGKFKYTVILELDVDEKKVILELDKILKTTPVYDVTGTKLIR
jgi:hypothetical protein